MEAHTPNTKTSMAGDLGRGALAGLVGTAAMTVAQGVEMRLSGRPPSMVPGQVASKLLFLKPRKKDLPKVSIRMHWAHGIAQGTLRAVVGRTTGLTGPSAGAAHFGMMWTSDAALYRMLGISPCRGAGRRESSCPTCSTRASTPWSRTPPTSACGAPDCDRRRGGPHLDLDRAPGRAI